MNNFNEFCIFCGESKNLTEYKDKFICHDCYEKLKKGVTTDYYLYRLRYCMSISFSLAILEATLVSIIIKLL